MEDSKWKIPNAVRQFSLIIYNIQIYIFTMFRIVSAVFTEFAVLLFAVSLFRYFVISVLCLR